MIDHFKKSKNSINWLKKVKQSIDRSIGLKKNDQLVSKNRSRDNLNDQRKENGKLYKKIDHSKIEWSKFYDRKKIACFPTDPSKMIDYRFLMGITTLWSMENAQIFAFTAERCQKYTSHQKKCSNKICS